MVDEDPLADVVIPPHPCPPTKHSLMEWYAEACQLAHLQLPLPDLSTRWCRAADDDRSALIEELATAGFTFVQIAHMVNTDVMTLGETLAGREGQAEVIVTTERVWREHPDWPLHEIGRAVGVSGLRVAQVLDRLGRKRAPGGKGHRRGVSIKHSPEIYERIREMREAGHSFSQIGKAVGIGSSTVFKMYQRRYVGGR